MRHGHGGLDWLKVLGLAVSGTGAALSVLKVVLVIAAIPNDLQHVKDEQDRQARLLEKVYDHVAFGAKGEMGPAPPVEKQDLQDRR